MDAVSDLQLMMNARADPCQDFFQFVCGNFDRAYPKSRSYLDVIAHRMREAYRDMLDSYVPSSSENELVVNTTVLAFRRCMEEYRDKLEDLLPLRALDDEIGALWSEMNPNELEVSLLTLLMTLSLNHGVPVLLRASVTQSIKSSGVNVLQLDVEDIGEPLGRWSTLDILMTITRNTTWVFAKNLSRTIFTTVTEMEALLSKSSQKPRKPVFVPVEDVGKVFARITPQMFLDIGDRLSLSAYFKKSGEFFTTNLEGLKQLSALMNRLDGTTLVQTIRFLLLKRFVPISTFKLTEVYRMAPSTAFKFRLHACSDFSLLLLPRITEFMFLRVWLEQEFSNISTSILKEVLNAFNTTSPYSRMDTPTKHSLSTALTTVHAIMGHVPGYDTRDLLNVRYEEAKLSEGSSFPSWVIRTLKHNAALSQSHLNASELVDIYSTDILPRVTYDPIFNYLQILPGRLLPPFRLDRSPKSINYGNLGTEIAQVLARSLYPSDPSRPSDATVFPPASLQIYRDALECVRESRRRYTKSEPEGNVSEGDLANLIGLRVAFR